MRAVLDTNVLISAILSPNGVPARLVAAWRTGRFTVISSPALVAELADVMARPTIADRLGWPAAEQAAFLLDLSVAVLLVEPTVTIQVIADDPADDRVLEAAVTGAADYIVSGDTHLLSLGAYEGIEVVTPARMLAMLAIG